MNNSHLQQASSEPDPVRVVQAANAIDDWFTASRFALLLGLLIAISYPQVLLGVETFFIRDYSIFGYPLAFYHKQMLWSGEIPLWDPYSYCGLPFLAQWNTMVLYPGTLLYLLLPLTWALGFFCLVHQFLAGFGMYWLARAWTGNKLASAIAGITYAHGGLVLNCLMWPNNIAAMALMPWVIWLTPEAWRKGGRRVLAAGLAAACQILSGGGEMVLFTWLILGVLALVDLFDPAFLKKRVINGLALTGLLAGCLTAAQLLPFVDFLFYSQRGQGVNVSEWPMPLQGLANFFVPLFNCWPLELGVYLQDNQYWTSSYYAGVAVVALAVIGCWWSPDRRGRWLSWLALFCVLMSFGKQTPFYDLAVTVLPFFRVMRYPVKFVVPVIFLLPLLGALGVAWLRGSTASRAARDFWWLWFLAIGCSIVIAGILGLARFRNGREVSWLVLLQNGSMRMTFLWLIVFGLWWLGRSPKIIVALGCLSLFWLDLWTHVPTQNPTVSPSVYVPNFEHPGLPLAPRYGESRFMLSYENLVGTHLKTLEDPFKYTLCRRLAQVCNLNLLDQHPGVFGFYPLYLQKMKQIVSMLYSTPLSQSKGLRDFLGVSLISMPGKPFDFTLQTNYMPLVTGGQQPLFASESMLTNRLLSTAFDAHRFVFLPAEAQPFILASNQTAVRIVSSNLGIHHLDLTVVASNASLVVIAQNNYHPWHAYVDGKRTRLWPANYAFQALQVPAGIHRIEVIYEDYLFYFGTLISLLTLAACSVAWFRFYPGHPARTEWSNPLQANPSKSTSANAP